METAIARRTSTARRIVREPEVAKQKTYTHEEVWKEVEDILTAHYGVPIRSK